MFFRWQQQILAFHQCCLSWQPVHHKPLSALMASIMVKDASCVKFKGTYSGMESSKHMHKLLTKKGVKTRRKWYQPHIGEPLEFTSKQHMPNRKGVTQAQSHRAVQLGHVLYSKICQLANSGELSEELLNKQIIFTRVKMHPTFSGINVYWEANRSDAAEIESLLFSLAGKLRSLLISYHVLGRIPLITFVRDRSVRSMSNLDELFEKADYGPDYIPSSVKSSFSLSQVSPANLPSNIVEQTQIDEEPLHEKISLMNLPNGQDSIFQESQRAPSDATEVQVDEAGWSLESKVEQNDTNQCGPQSNLEDEVGKSQFDFRSNLYGLPRDALMRKVLASKSKVRYQSQESQIDTSTLLKEVKEYSKVKTRDKMKEKSIQQRDSTKTKQRLLEQEFIEMHESVKNVEDS